MSLPSHGLQILIRLKILFLSFHCILGQNLYISIIYYNICHYVAEEMSRNLQCFFPIVHLVTFNVRLYMTE